MADDIAAKYNLQIADVETILDEFLKLNHLEGKQIKQIRNDMYIKGNEAFQFPKRKT